MLPDRLNPRLWLRNALGAFLRWLNRPTQAEVARADRYRAEILRMFDAAFSSFAAPSDPPQLPHDRLH
jgi:hypothetical protein